VTGTLTLPSSRPIGSVVLATRQEVMEAEVKLGNTTPSSSIVNASNTASSNEVDPTVQEPVSQDWSSEEDWPVLAVETKLFTDPHCFPEKITILVRIPAAGGATRLHVRMLPRSRIAAPSFYDFPSPAVKFQPMEGTAEVVDGLSWLTLTRPTSFKNAVLTVPSGALVAVCQAEPSVTTDQLLVDLILQVRTLQYLVLSVAIGTSGELARSVN